MNSFGVSGKQLCALEINNRLHPWTAVHIDSGFGVPSLKACGLKQAGH